MRSGTAIAGSASRPRDPGGVMGSVVGLIPRFLSHLPYDGPMSELDRNVEDEDLALAAELQSALLPQTCPSCHPHHEAAAKNRMCLGVGGDFYDFLRLNEDQIALLIGDVVGHGVRASLMMAQIMGYLRNEGMRKTSPTQVVAGLNRMLLDLGERVNDVMPCSLFYGVLDLPSGTCFFVNAGHPWPILCDGVKCRWIGAHDMLLGVEDFEPAEQCHTFTSGQRLVLYTDGLTDAFNGAGERFGPSRLLDLVSSALERGADDLAEHVFAEVDAFRAGSASGDDETIVVIDRT